MDVTQALRDAENALRDFISAELMTLHGFEWVQHTGISADRIAKWHERKASEQKRQESGVVDERIIYYADFYDLKTILKKNWQSSFSEAFGDWKTIEVYLTELERLRDPDAHRRELLPHQKHLILGISGEIRTRIVRFRSKHETNLDCFPRIESARDSLGNIWVPGVAGSDFKTIFTNLVLHPGDALNFVVSARDPDELPLEFGLRIGDERIAWQSDDTFSVTISEDHISANTEFKLFIKSNRSYHASAICDDSVCFIYKILPVKP